MKKFSNITTRNELADYLEIPRKDLAHILYKQKVDSYYISFDIPKKNGGIRHIHAPISDLKIIQKKLSEALWEHQETIWAEKGINPNISHAFEKGKSIISNAKIHRNKRLLLNVDLENFFDSFHFGRVRGYFNKNNDFQLPIEVATVIAQLSCYNGSLPQGAPSSPIITNYICQIFDFRVLAIAKRFKLDYTRYADDLTFSTNNRAFIDTQEDFHRELTKIIESAGFRINKDKTRLQYKDSKQEVTGLVVNKKLSVDREYCRKTKAMAFNLYKQGDFTINDEEGSIKQLEGRFSFINQLDRYNNKLENSDRCNSKTLNGREKQYQKFLFYKYFYSNDKPLIITEGKTDIAYLKSALKKFHSDYPSLITKITNNEHKFHVSFLKRSDRLKYFLNIAIDGADTMQNIYNYFSSNKSHRKRNEWNFPDYLSYFNDVSGGQPKQPIVLVFDNELENNKKPLKKFVNHAKLNEEMKDELAKNLCIKLADNGNLFLMTNNLVDDKKECELEDLFDKETLDHKIGIKTFSREDGFDEDKHYGKAIFSEYISNNYNSINFEGFRNILNIVNSIVESY